MKNSEGPELSDNRIRVITGHYGSGKTEFSVNYAMRLAKRKTRTALVDLDIANPYFRSRERKRLLEQEGVQVYSNTFGYDITADLPAITAAIKAPLEDPSCSVVVDAGGDELGARILIQFEKYWRNADCDLFCVLNANRPETSSLNGALDHISRIENAVNLKITGLINNTHMLAETRTDDILKGYRLVSEVSQRLNVPLRYNCCPEGLVQNLEKEANRYNDFSIFPLRLYMRASWLDR
jgi:ATPases involved in chromosome partitioning